MLLLLLACPPPNSSDSAVSSVDLVNPVPSGEVRAGVVTDTAALFGGVSAEGRIGDVKIYNSKVRFIIQQPGDSSYYSEYGGMLIDADIVRPSTEPGRDTLDELGPMVGLARVVKASKVTVLDNGKDGTARVRVEGPTAPLTLATGALESPDLVAQLNLWVTTDYSLSPDSNLLEIHTVVESRESEPQSLSVGETGFVSQEVVERYQPGTGLGDPTGTEGWTGLVGRHNEVAVALMSTDGILGQGTMGVLLGSLGPGLSGFGPTENLDPGGKMEWSVWLGAGPDLATLSDEWLRRRGESSQTLSGTITSGGKPLAGARVHVLDEKGLPFTLAFSDTSGHWTAQAPVGSAQIAASGVGPSEVVDLPAGHAWASPYEADNALTLQSLAQGSTPIPFASGYGLSAIGSSPDVDLPAPGTLQVTVADKKPAVIKVDPLDTVTSLDRRLVPEDGRSFMGYLRDGSLDLPLPAGRYQVVVYRGVRDELVHEEVEIQSGQTLPFAATIPTAYTLNGVVTGDPHTHAAPSGDGSITMEDRLITMASNGVDVHFGTDHDHISDYRPLLAPLGLESVLTSVVADEVSPVLRGHFNAWPARFVPGAANHGAWLWWQGYTSTADIFQHIRAMQDDGVLQANHPVGKSGMFGFAGFDINTGTISNPDSWSSDFDAMEALNSDDWTSYFPAYLALINRGLVVTPVGVSDSHSHTGGGLGINLTFFDTSGSTDASKLVDAVRRHATVVSHGPYIDARIGGEFSPGKLVAGNTSVLTATVYAPSWMPVDTLTLLRDGTAVASVTCDAPAPTPCSAEWTLDPEKDASYVLVAESARPMEYAHPGNLAWAATSAIRVDVGGDGWTAPLPSLFP